MEINYIREFAVLAESDGFQEASNRLFISQSSLSKHLRTLEAELGVPLLDRSGRKATLNRYGYMFLPFAKQISQIMQEYTEALGAETHRQSNTLLLGSIPAMAQYQITSVIADFTREQPDCEIHVEEADAQELKVKLLEGQCELAFLRDDDTRSSDVNRLEYAVDHLVAVMAKDHPLAQAGELHIEQLRKEPLLLLQSQTYLNRLCMQVCKEAGFIPRVAFSGHRTENIADLAAKGMGVGLLMRKQAEYLQEKAIAIKDITPSIESHIYLCYLRQANLSPMARSFILCMNNRKARE
ncbi:MAG: LysR family transcriptional regulator [Oscillospiraceae bacterium]